MKRLPECLYLSSGKDPATGEVLVHTLEWLSLPSGRKVKVIRVRPDVVIVAKKEVEHLKRIGFWVFSDSHIASSMLVAPKATDPWIRLVTDYAWLTPHLSVPKHPLKHVKDSLAFMSNGDPATGERWESYCDLDMMASFHQFRIDEPSSYRLSVVGDCGREYYFYFSSLRTFADTQMQTFFTNFNKSNNNSTKRLYLISTIYM